MFLTQTLRYLGYSNNTADDDIKRQIEEVITELQTVVTSKSKYRKFACTVADDTVIFENLVILSADLCRHLAGCTEVVLLAVTLGVGADTYIRRCSVESMTRATIASAVCAAMCEAECNTLEQEIKSKTDYFLTPRFSPGYGDLKLSYQKDILDMLNCSKHIGLTLTQGMMLIPTKSVTAFIGLTTNQSCNSQKCLNCTNLKCEFREVTFES